MLTSILTMTEGGTYVTYFTHLDLSVFLRKSIIFHLLLSMFTFSPVSGLGQFSNIFMFIETQLSDY